MKRLLLLAVSALLIVGLSACGRDAAATPTTASTTDATVTTTTALVPQPTVTTTTTTPKPALISKADAKSAAFARAGVKESQVSRLTVELDYDDDERRFEYEVEFHVDHVEYAVEVDAETGKILDFDKDYD